MVQLNLGNYDDAIECFNKAINVLIVVFDENHPKIADTFANIGVVYIKKGDYETALEYYNRAVAIYEETYPNDHPKIKSTNDKISEIQAKLKEQEN